MIDPFPCEMTDVRCAMAAITELVILQWLAALAANSVDTLVQLRYKIEFRTQSFALSLGSSKFF